MDLVWLLIAGN